jgi:hypothetical protein
MSPLPENTPSHRCGSRQAGERSAWFWVRLFLWGAAIGGVLILPKFGQRFQAMQRRAAYRDQQWRQQWESQAGAAPATSQTATTSGGWWLLAAMAAGVLLLGGFAWLALRSGSRPDRSQGAAAPTLPDRPATASASASAGSAPRPPPAAPSQIA